jgi:hypothetical protein
VESTYELSVRLMGKLPSLEELTKSLGVWPSSYMPMATRRRGRFHVWTADLSDTEYGDPTPEIVSRATEMLRRMAAGLAQLDRDNSSAELYVTAMRWDPQSSLTLPRDLMAVAAEDQLQLRVSIFCGAWMVAAPAPDDAGDEVQVADNDSDGEPRNRYKFALRVHGARSVTQRVLGSLKGLMELGPARRQASSGPSVPDGDEVWVLDLTPFEAWQRGVPDGSTVTRILAALTALGSPEVGAELSVKCHCRQEQGSLELPADLVSAVAAGGLALRLSMVCLDVQDEEDGESVDE